MENIRELIESYKSGKTSVEEYIKKIYEKIGDDANNVFITLNKGEAIKRAKELDESLKAGCEITELFGVPFTIKDNVMTKGLRTTCASKMLEDYIPPYDAEIIKKLNAAGAIIIGKTNMDEFAMGASSESSYFGPTKNAIDNSLIPGGSSSGAGVGQKLEYGIVSIGSDTGGSVRQPASYNSVYGYMPSYGTISRRGVSSMANTLDQVGILAANVEDIIRTINVIGGHDDVDQTSIKKEKIEFNLDGRPLNNVKIAYIDVDDKRLDSKVKEDYLKAIEILKNMGADLKAVKLECEKYLSPCYSILSTSEASSNLARFDGVRYGFEKDGAETVEDLIRETRTEGFGRETKRRIVLGMYYLGERFSRQTYNKALVARRKIKKEVEKIFEEVEILVTPSSTDLPRKIGDSTGSTDAFRSGDYHVLVNLSGRCAISIPMREDIGGSVQFIGNRFDDENLLNYAKTFSKEVK